jgi:hypothetical protein
MVMVWKLHPAQKPPKKVLCKLSLRRQLLIAIISQYKIQSELFSCLNQSKECNDEGMCYLTAPNSFHGRRETLLDSYLFLYPF